MSKAFNQLSMNLAGGMSRRKAFWQFFAGLGVLGLGAKKMSADSKKNPCNDFCEQQADVFMSLCLAASQTCKTGCAEFTLISFNGGVVVNSTSIGFNGRGGPFVCVTVPKH